jgi:hypothetical protein
MDPKISEEELESFLAEAKIASQPNKNLQKEKGESLEKLLEDIMGSATAEGPPFAADGKDKNRPHHSEDEKLKRQKSPLVPLLLSIVFLGGCFLGTIFGFYWGSTKRVSPLAPSLEEMDAKLSRLARQIEAIYEKITPVEPLNEVIEPTVRSNEFEKLAPKAKS